MSEAPTDLVATERARDLERFLTFVDAIVAIVAPAGRDMAGS